MTQAGILEAIPAHGRYLSLRLHAPGQARPALEALCRAVNGRDVVVGLGPTLVANLAAIEAVPGLRAFDAPRGSHVVMPSTPVDLWVWLRGDEPGALLQRGRRLTAPLARVFEVIDEVATFRHGHGLDLTGYEDGTENPRGSDAAAVALVGGQGLGLDGGSLVAFQRWQHDLAGFDAMSPMAQDHAIGRRRLDNEELDDAPATAHVKRTAQESFEPEAFVLRRSMPWADGSHCGLYFTAFASAFDPFEAQLRRMSGAEDGLVDALFSFSRPLTGAFCWCPPMHDGALDLRVLGFPA